MWWKMMEEEWSLEKERIAARNAALLMGISMGMDTGIGNLNAMMQSR